MSKWTSFAFQYASTLALVVAVMGAGARSTVFHCEPKVPAKLQKK